MSSSPYQDGAETVRREAIGDFILVAPALVQSYQLAFARVGAPSDGEHPAQHRVGLGRQHGRVHYESRAFD